MEAHQVFLIDLKRTPSLEDASSCSHLIRELKGTLDLGLTSDVVQAHKRQAADWGYSLQEKRLDPEAAYVVWPDSDDRSIGQQDLVDLPRKILQAIAHATTSKLHFFTCLSLVHRVLPRLGRSTLLTCITGKMMLWLWHAGAGWRQGRQFEAFYLPAGRSIVLPPNMAYSTLALADSCYAE
jgi:hypothetical protein